METCSWTNCVGHWSDWSLHVYLLHHHWWTLHHESTQQKEDPPHTLPAMSQAHQRSHHPATTPSPVVPVPHTCHAAAAAAPPPHPEPQLSASHPCPFPKFPSSQSQVTPTLGSTARVFIGGTASQVGTDGLREGSCLGTLLLDGRCGAAIPPAFLSQPVSPRVAQGVLSVLWCGDRRLQEANQRRLSRRLLGQLL
ncbi:uncharacterized protein LOC135115070 isoform X2 [Scylla paramamosain]|uniref:uncharacterized protein LOC135115070 isoform X2 n=1 Tax=Scylla paramamosain TaxID=85552 RepID=UPI003082BCE4